LSVGKADAARKPAMLPSAFSMIASRQHPDECARVIRRYDTTAGIKLFIDIDGQPKWLPVCAEAIGVQSRAVPDIKGTVQEPCQFVVLVWLKACEVHWEWKGC
jgi:hypothetical protein